MLKELSIVVALQFFHGNYDRNSIVNHSLRMPIKARILRFKPTKKKTFISMRVEIYGCPVGTSQFPAPVSRTNQVELI